MNDKTIVGNGNAGVVTPTGGSDLNAPPTLAEDFAWAGTTVRINGCSLGLLLRDASRLIRRRFVQMAKEVGVDLNYSEAAALVYVAQSTGMSQTRLATLLDIETISVVRLIDTLEAAGLIERRPHPTDRRVRTLWPTAAAETTLTKIRTIAQFVDSQALVDIPEHEGKRLLDILKIIRCNLTPSLESLGCRSDAEAAA